MLGTAVASEFEIRNRGWNGVRGPYNTQHRLLFLRLSDRSIVDVQQY